MGELVNLLRDDKQESVNALYHLRKEYDLTLLQAATALKLSTTQLEREELRDKSKLELNFVRKKYEMFCISSDNDTGKNLLFGCLPLRVAREIQRKSIAKFAADYGFSESHWRKIESHSREIDPDILRTIENDVKSAFKELCQK